MCNFNTENILVDTTECNKEGGLVGIVHYAYVEDIADWPALPTSPPDFATSATLSGPFVMKPSKTFKKLESELEMSEYKGESQGNIGSLSAKSTYTFKQQTITAQLTGFINANKNRRFAIIIELPNGLKRVIGTKNFPARMATFAEGTGAKLVDERMTMFTIEAQGGLPMYTTETIPV
jgi:hypothetical protein